MFVAVFEGGLGDAGFVVFAEAFGDHACRTVPLWRLPAADRDSDCVRVRARSCYSWLRAPRRRSSCARGSACLLRRFRVRARTMLQ
jgi:hypothetical protein